MKPAIEVFKTNVENPEQASYLTQLLCRHFPQCRIVFDLDDCDRILKMEGLQIQAEQVRKLMEQKGFSCQVLD